MATISFDEKVVVTDPEMVRRMKADLEDLTPVSYSQKSDSNAFRNAEENGKKWTSRLLRSVR
ncbi:MAG: hypothetical protein K2G44_05695 [Clostridia bacterium]|nr:hypothetical protein [Clostridia bacterium]